MGANVVDGWNVMLEKDLISIIVPVYNVEPYLEECIKSLIMQSYRNIEILLVDDGSTDASGALCDKWGKSDSRVHVFHQENKGLGAARNAGIDHAKGQWIVFVDSDDWVSEYYVEHLYSLAVQHQADIAVTGFTKFIDPKSNNKATQRNHNKIIRQTLKTSKDSVDTENRADTDRTEFGKPDHKKCSDISRGSGILEAKATQFDSEQAICDMWYQRHISNFAWGKIFRRDIFDTGVRFPTDVLYEDLACMYLCFSKARRIVYAPITDYCYRSHNGSIMNAPYNGRKMDRVKVSLELLEWAQARTENQSSSQPEGKAQPREKASLTALQKAAEERFFLSNVQVLREIPFKEQYQGEIRRLAENIRRYRGSVLRNPEVKAGNRVIATASYLGIYFLKVLGNVYTWTRKVCKAMKSSHLIP